METDLPFIKKQKSDSGDHFKRVYFSRKSGNLRVKDSLTFNRIYDI